MSVARFDLGALFAAIEAARVRQGLSWAALSREVGVSAATIRRYEGADDAEADGVLALVRWVGVAPESFVINGRCAATLLAEQPSMFVRVDMEAIRRADTGARTSPGQTRTTIQRLVEIADRTRQPLASLTRLTSY